MMLREVFTHPFPETLNRVEIRGVRGKREEGQPDLISVMLNLSTATMVGGAIPDDEDVAQIIA